jgi:hypothetical protein
MKNKRGAMRVQELLDQHYQLNRSARARSADQTKAFNAAIRRAIRVDNQQRREISAVVQRRMQDSRKDSFDRRLPANASRLIADSVGAVLRRAAKRLRIAKSINVSSRDAARWTRSYQQFVASITEALLALHSARRLDPSPILLGNLSDFRGARGNRHGGHSRFRADTTARWYAALLALIELGNHTTGISTSSLRPRVFQGGGTIDMWTRCVLLELGVWWRQQGWTPTTYERGAFCEVARLLLRTDDIKPSLVREALDVSAKMMRISSALTTEPTAHIH